MPDAWLRTTAFGGNGASTCAIRSSKVGLVPITPDAKTKGLLSTIFPMLTLMFGIGKLIILSMNVLKPCD